MSKLSAHDAERLFESGYEDVPGFWRSSRGKIVRITELNDFHLKSIVNKIDTQGFQTARETELRNELANRKAAGMEE